eukprot:3710135-Rhodomonas_salina.1
MSQRLALPQRPRYPSGSIRTYPVAAQVEISQRLALHQHPHQPPGSLITNPIVAHVKPNK